MNQSIPEAMLDHWLETARLLVTAKAELRRTRAIARKCWGEAMLSADFGVPPGSSERGRFLQQLAREQPWLKEES